MALAYQLFYRGLFTHKKGIQGDRLFTQYHTEQVKGDGHGGYRQNGCHSVVLQENITLVDIGTASHHEIVMKNDELRCFNSGQMMDTIHELLLQLFLYLWLC